MQIPKLSHQVSTGQTVERKCSVSLAQLRKHQALHTGETGLHYEIWCYSLSYGFRGFEVHKESVREIPRLSLCTPVTRKAGGVA